jgi:hypothetical protein
MTYLTSIADPPKAKEGAWLDSFLSNVNTIELPQKRGMLGFFVVRKSMSKQQDIKAILRKKSEIDELLVKACISEIIRDLYAKAFFRRLGIDCKNGNIFLWVEVQNEDQVNWDKIDQVVLLANAKYQGSGLKINHIIVEEFLSLPIPPDYKEIRR